MQSRASLISSQAACIYTLNYVQRTGSLSILSVYFIESHTSHYNRCLYEALWLGVALEGLLGITNAIKITRQSRRYLYLGGGRFIRDMGIKLSIGRQCLFLSHQTVGKFVRYRGLSGNLFNFSLGETTDKLHPPVKSSGTDLGLATLSCFTIACRTLHTVEVNGK